MANIEISDFTGLSDKTVGEWHALVAESVELWLFANAKPLGGPGKIVEIDEAKFGKRKYNKGAYREGMWILGGVDRETGECFLVPCPGNSRSGPTLVPIIQRLILPGTTVYSDCLSIRFPIGIPIGIIPCMSYRNSYRNYTLSVFFQAAQDSAFCLSP